jgi:type III secretion protein N (ATPase)
MTALVRSGGPDPLVAALHQVDTLKRVGRVAEARGTLIRATGVNARIGEVCELREPGGQQVVTAEVVAVERGTTLLAPLGTLQGISAVTEVGGGAKASVAAGMALLGRVIDATGEVIDGQPAPLGLVRVPIYRDAPNALTRTSVRRPFQTGIRAVDTALTLEEGHRVGIFSSARPGRNTLLGMLARSGADVNVIVLLGARRGEVREFIDDQLGAEAFSKSVVVVATLDRPALERARAAHIGTAIAEHFRDQAKRVLFLFDSVTLFARALRDVGLTVGEPASRHGYPPSVFAALPGLFERAGTHQQGSITGFYTVLLEDGAEDPIADEVRSNLDGHINLSRHQSQPVNTQ